MADTYTFDPLVRTFVISKGASLGYGSEPALSTALLRYGLALIDENEFTLSVTHNVGISGLGILVSTNWPTAAWIATQTADSFLLGFSVPAAPSGQVYWEVSDTMPLESVTTDATFHVISHFRGNAQIPLFFTPNWPTLVWDSTPDRTADTATVYFSQPAPVDATLAYRPID